MNSRRILIFGSGNVGSTLGKRFSEAGHKVGFAEREPSANLSAVAEADILLLAVPGDAVQGLLAGLGNLTGKIIIDATNPAFAASDHGPGPSAGEQVAAWAPGARVVKMFNTTGFENMADPKYQDGALTMFYAGSDVEANQVAHELAEQMGFEAQCVGTLAQAKLLEALASLWGAMAYGQKLGRNIGFRLLHR